MTYSLRTHTLAHAGGIGSRIGSDLTTLTSSVSGFLHPYLTADVNNFGSIERATTFGTAA